MNSYTHFSLAERYQIAGLLAAGKQQNEIAASLSRSKSTICRELGRRQPGSAYCPEQAHQASRRPTTRAPRIARPYGKAWPTCSVKT